MTHEGWEREGRGAGRSGGRATGRGAGLGLRGPGGARPPRHATTTAAAVFVQLALRCGRNWAAQWHLARAVGKRFRGCRAKRLYVHNADLSLLGAAIYIPIGGRGAHSHAASCQGTSWALGSWVPLSSAPQLGRWAGPLRTLVVLFGAALRVRVKGHRGGSHGWCRALVVRWHPAVGRQGPLGAPLEQSPTERLHLTCIQRNNLVGSLVTRPTVLKAEVVRTPSVSLCRSKVTKK